MRHSILKNKVEDKRDQQPLWNSSLHIQVHAPTHSHEHRNTCIYTGTCVFFLSNIKNTPNSNMHFLTSVYQKNKDKIKTFTLLYFHNMFSVCLESFHYARKFFLKDQTYGANVKNTSKFSIEDNAVSQTPVFLRTVWMLTTHPF